MTDYQAIHGKTFYLIVTAADPQRRAADEALADFRGFLRCLPGAKKPLSFSAREHGIKTTYIVIL